jgi:type VI secretion system secreted protein VgrG
MSDLITFASSMLPGTTRVIGFRGVEAISRPYRFEVFVLLKSEELDFELADAVGTKARVMIDDSKGPPSVFAGILGALDLLHEVGGQALIRALIVPRLSELALSTHSRIFTKKSPVDVIKAVLEDNGVTEYEVHVSASEVEEHICQYRESDLDFISRWMEREGIRYYFEHSEEGEKLILADDSNYPAEPAGLPVRYYPQAGLYGSGAPASFRSFSSRNSNVSASVKLRDNDYAKPTFDLSGSAPVSPNGTGEVNLYGQRFFSPGNGQRLAQIRAQSLAVLQSVYHAAGPRLHLHAGYTFELEEHTRPSFNTKYLVVESHHHGNQATGLDYFQKLIQLEHEDPYLVDLIAIPAKTQFRPEMATIWPRIYSFENAVVDGPATSEYAQIDSQGRYSVKFHFDESALKDGQASTLVRMMQPHGGGIEGFHFPLRKGTEVVVSFLGGDPDRPVISGVVPNTLTPSAITSGNHTKNVIQTGGRNRFELEDLAGQQRITLSTPHTNTYVRMGAPNDAHNMILNTEGQTLLNAGGYLDITVGDHKHETITGEVTEIYKSTKNETVTAALTETYNDTKSETVTGALTETYKSTKDETVTGAVTETYKDKKTEHVTGLVTETYDAGQTKKITGDKNETISGKYKETIGSDATYEIKGATATKHHGPYDVLYKSDNVNVVQGVKSNTFFGAANANNFGITNSNFFGLSNSNFFGIALNTTFALSINTSLGVNIDIGYSADIELKYSNKVSVTWGIAFAMKYGVALNMNYGAEVTVNTVKLEDLDVRISQLPLDMKQSALEFKADGLYVVS